MTGPATPHVKTASPPVIVIGGGVVGIATAIWLQREGRQVTLIDKGVSKDRASFGNAGVLAASSVLPVTMPGLLGKLPKMVMSGTEPIFLRWPYLPRLIPWALRYLSHANEADVVRIANALAPIIGNSLEDHLLLAQGTQARQHIKPCDFGVLYKNKSAFLKDPLPWNIRKDLGFNWTELEGEERTAYDPTLSHKFNFLAALKGHGQITDPGAYVSDLTKHFKASGGAILKDEVTDISHSNGKVTGVRTKDSMIEASAVAITAGAWSPLLTKKLGVKIPVEAESGYHMEFWEPSRMPRVPTLVPSGKFILSPMDGRLRVAGVVEFGGLKNIARNKPFETIKYHLDKVLPGLSYTRETRWMGHRPAPTDSIPIIDQLSHIKGVYLGFGHQHVGLTGSARTGKILAKIMCGHEPDIDLNPYRVSRFTHFSRNSSPPSNHAQQLETC